MSAIGDYVHLTWKGYEEGTNKIGVQKALSVLPQKHEDIKKRYNQLGKKQTRIDLQKKFNTMMSWLSGESKDAEKIKQMREIYDDITKQDLFKGIEFTREYGLQGKHGISLNEQVSQDLIDLQVRLKELQKNIKKMKKDSLDINKIISEALKIKKNLRKYINNHKDILDLVKDRESYQRVLATTDNFLKTIEKGELTINKNRLDFGQTYMYKGAKSYQYLADIETDKINTDHQNLLSGMMDVINSLLYKDWRQKAGFFAEYLFQQGLTIGLEAGTALAKTVTLPDAKERTLKGDQIYGLSSIKTKSYKDSDEDGNRILNSISSVKADLEVILPDSDDVANISLKNTSSFAGDFGWISIVSGIPLLSLLQDENEGNFVNHYLNLVISHEEDKEGEKGYRDKYKNTIQEAHNVMMLMLALKGLTGSRIAITKDNYMPEVGYFVTIDNVKNKVYVFSMADILRVIDNTLFATNSASNVLSGYSRDWFFDKDINVRTEDKSEINQRLLQIVQRAYDIKVHMKISTSILRKAAQSNNYGIFN